MSSMLSMPLTMIPMVSMIPMVPMIAMVVFMVVPMVVSISMVLVERKGVEERFFQPRLFSPFNNLCKLLKLVEFDTGSLRTPGLVRRQHVVLERVQVEEDGGVVLRVRLPLLPHLIHVLSLQQLLGLAGHQGGSRQDQAWDQGREKRHLNNLISISFFGLAQLLMTVE